MKVQTWNGAGHDCTLPCAPPGQLHVVAPVGAELLQYVPWGPQTPGWVPLFAQKTHSMGLPVQLAQLVTIVPLQSKV
jgi:hypothetical protein